MLFQTMLFQWRRKSITRKDGQGQRHRIGRRRGWPRLESLEDRCAPNAQSFTSALAVDNNPAVFGQPVNLSVSVTGDPSVTSTPTGNVAFMDGSSTLGSATLDNSGHASLSISSLSVGSHALSAVYGGDSNFDGSTSAALSESVNQANTSTAISSANSSASLGQPITFSATISAVPPGAGVPTGSVTFLDGTNTLGTASLDQTEAASLTASRLGVGSHAITAVYSGDGNYSSSTSSVMTATINQDGSRVALTSPGNATVSGQAASFSVLVSAIDTGAGVPTGAVTLMDGASSIDTANLDKTGAATFNEYTLSAGSHTLTAVYNGDGKFLGNTSSAVTQTVNQANTSTVLSAPTSAAPSSQLVTLTATVSVLAPGAGAPSGIVTFLDGSNILGSVNVTNGSASLSTPLSVGQRVITASYAGDTNFLGSLSSAVNVLVGTTNERFVDQVYQQLLGRPADTTGLATWSSALDQGAPRDQFVRAILGSSEYLINVVQNLYSTLLGRPADQQGLSTFTDLLANGGTIEQVEAIMIGSAEYLQKNGATNDSFLSGLYHDVLGRALDASGQATFDLLLANGAAPGDIAWLVLNSAEAIQNKIQGYYQQFLNRSADPSGDQLYVDALETGARDADIITALLSSTEFYSNV